MATTNSQSAFPVIVRGNDFKFKIQVFRQSNPDNNGQTECTPFDLTSSEVSDIKVFVKSTLHKYEFPFTINVHEIILFINGTEIQNGLYGVEITLVKGGSIRSFSPTKFRIVESDEEANITSDIETIALSPTVMIDYGTESMSNSMGSLNNYELATNKPRINGMEILGDQSPAHYGLQPKGPYLTTESDPTVPSWAKQPTKPTYTATEVGAATEEYVNRQIAALPTPDVSGQISAHNMSETAHVDIRTSLDKKIESKPYSLTAETEVIATKAYQDGDGHVIKDRYQRKLIAGSGIVITNNVIRSIGGGGGGEGVLGVADVIVNDKSVVADNIATLTVPTKTSELANDAGFITASDITGGGDMTQAVYDTNSNGVVDNAERLGGELPDHFATAAALANKVDRVTGKKLSANDYTDADKAKVDALKSASTKDTPATGNASITQVVMGDDTRLSDARTPLAHTLQSHSGTLSGSQLADGSIAKQKLDTAVVSSLAKADSALQSFTESDPTVPSWAKQPTKPTYTAAEVGALPSNTALFSGNYNDLTNKPVLPAANDCNWKDISGWSGILSYGISTNILVKAYRYPASWIGDIEAGNYYMIWVDICKKSGYTKNNSPMICYVGVDNIRTEQYTDQVSGDILKKTICGLYLNSSSNLEISLELVKIEYPLNSDKETEKELTIEFSNPSEVSGGIVTFHRIYKKV